MYFDPTTGELQTGFATVNPKWRDASAFDRPRCAADAGFARGGNVALGFYRPNQAMQRHQYSGTTRPASGLGCDACDHPALAGVLPNRRKPGMGALGQEAGTSFQYSVTMGDLQGWWNQTAQQFFASISGQLATQYGINLQSVQDTSGVFTDSAVVQGTLTSAYGALGDVASIINSLITTALNNNGNIATYAIVPLSTPASAASGAVATPTGSSLVTTSVTPTALSTIETYAPWVLAILFGGYILRDVL